MALKLDTLLAKTEPIRDVGNASVITDLRRNQNKACGSAVVFQSEKSRVRVEQHADTKVIEEGEEEMQPIEVHAGCKYLPAAYGGAHAGAAAWLEEAVILWETRGKKASVPRLEQPILEGLHPMEG